MRYFKCAVLFLCAAFFSNCLNAQGNLAGAHFDFESTDSSFTEPYIDIDEWRDTPVRHRYIHGGFRDNNTRFSFYFPPKERYEGRFYQYITPAPDSETLSQNATGEYDVIGFSITHGAYFIETNGGGRIDFTRPQQQQDPTIGAYRANAASAVFSRVVAKELYGGRCPYGYAFGGSGGAYRTIGGMENTVGVWDGVVPFVPGSPVAIPNMFSVRMHAMRVLKNKFPQIVDAIEPGGSGDMYAGLNDEEKAALEEVTKMGFPPKSWFGYKNMDINAFPVLYQGVMAADRTYFTEDFWNKEGYLGANPPESLRKARLQKQSKIKASINMDKGVAMGLTEPVPESYRGSVDKSWKSMGGSEEGMPVAFQLEDGMPDVDFLGGDLILLSGEAKGLSLQITKVEGDKVVLGPNAFDILVKIKPGDAVRVDNSNFLAAQTYHRHQVPPDREYHVWDQFHDEKGNPIYPQRPVQLGPIFTQSAAGCLPSGKVNGKMIVLCSLLDREALPWQGDWYHSKIKAFLGDGMDDGFRLWYTENALHGYVVDHEESTHVISYVGILQQALLDLSAWVEKGIAPAATTNYRIEDGQVAIPATADERKGIQPVVRATANGSKRVDIAAGETVTFKAVVDIPEKMGQLVLAEWDFDGSKTYAHTVDLSGAKVTADGEHVEFTTTCTFSEPGVYFPTVRVASQRNGDRETPYARILNLDRVRVVVDGRKN
ncbi:MAG: hypothetical protein LBS04_07720 [Tannerellaceae bacterium]|jgi:hypothetical protein|nr:hypothetical protein [Tannerellaceae bacterium]